MVAGVEIWAAVLISGLVTFALRLSFIVLHGRMTMPSWFTRGLSFVPVAVLSAIILPEIMYQNNVLNLSSFNARLIAGVLAVLVAWRTKNVWITIAVGLAVMLLLQLAANYF